MTSPLRRALGVLALAPAAVLLAVATAAPAQAAAGITITPAGPYTNGAKVTVAGTGFPASTTVVVAQCKGATAPTGPQDCADVSTGALVYATSDKDGAVKATLTIVVGPIRDGVVCTGSSCSIAAFALGDPQTVAVAKFGTAGAQATSVPSQSPTSPAPATSSPGATTAPATGAATTPPATSAPSTTKAARTTRANSGRLANTGPELTRGLALTGIIAAQAGLILMVRAMRSTRPRGRHL